MIDPVVQRITNKDGSIDAKQMIQELISARDRIRDLEAALREIADFAEQFIADDEDGDERMYKVHQIADNAIPFTAETGPGPCPICTAPAGTHFINCERWELLGTTAETGDVKGE